MNYSIRTATIDDIPHFVAHREQMFRDMGIPAEFERVVLNASTFGQSVYADIGYVVANEPMMRLKL